eukprot:3805423-Amphidinium_carterae.1
MQCQDQGTNGDVSHTVGATNAAPSCEQPINVQAGTGSDSYGWFLERSLAYCTGLVPRGVPNS